MSQALFARGSNHGNEIKETRDTYDARVTAPTNARRPPSLNKHVNAISLSSTDTMSGSTSALPSEQVPRSDHARSAPLRAESVRERGDGSPASAVSRRDDPGRDKFRDVPHGRFDTVLHGCACKVIAAARHGRAMTRVS